MAIHPFFIKSVVSVLGVALLAGCGGRGDDGSGDQGSVGFTDSKILIGANAPLTGPVSAFAGLSYGARAYFKHLNDTEGGVMMADGKKRKIEFIIRDDGYDPARSVGVAKKLVEEDKVAALVEPFGTDPNLAIRSYLNQRKVPQIFAQSTNPHINLERDKYPYTITGSASSVIEAAVLAKYAVQVRPNAKIAVLRANDEAGEAYVAALKKALEGTDATVVEEQSYASTDVSIDSQMSILAKSGADVLANFGTPQFAALAISGAAELDWNPLVLLPSQASSPKSVLEPAGLENAKGAITVGWFKDPADPQWKDDKSMEVFRTAIAKYERAANPDDSFVSAGWAVAEVFAEVLKTTEPNRQALADAVGNLSGQTSGMLLPGINFRTSDDDSFAIESLWIQEFDGHHYNFVGTEPISLEGTAASLVGN